LRGFPIQGLSRRSFGWVTNFAAPYRLPVWDHIAEAAELSVYLLESSSRTKRGTGNRGLEWSGDARAAYETVEVPTWSVSRGERTLYTARTKFLGSHHQAIVLAGWESPAYWQALLAARRQRIATVGFYESTLNTNEFTSGPIALARRRFFHCLDAVVVPGLAARQAVLHMGIPDEKIHVGFNAVDVEGIHQAANKWRLMNGAVSASNGHQFLYVGRLIGLKNVSSLVKAFNAIRAPGDRLTIVGTGPEQEGLEKLVGELLMEESVEFVGLVAYSELSSKLAAAHTLVLPSKKEVWGLVANEALAAGLQCVLSDACGVTASVSHMRGVIACDPSVDGIAGGLVAAKQMWLGPISQPEILNQTPRRFGDVFLHALETASSAGAQR
jgi:glycosyltransferase involved in cell wall biosynthesis